jgi:exopolyphosphatase / guanosine-5'-triphosphate,3'-diphosphate pyrophosphatase
VELISRLRGVTRNMGMSNRSDGDMPSSPQQSSDVLPVEGNGIATSSASVAEQFETTSASTAERPVVFQAPAVRQHVSNSDRADYHRPSYAALDLGTNNCRLLVASPTKPGRFRVVDSFSRIVRLGEGLGATGRLSDAAMARAVDALVICAAKLKTRSMRKIRLIATEACRSAENGDEFLERVKARTGLRLEVINRETEAKLAVAGCAPLVANNAPGAVLFDIGGGSTEVILCDLRTRRGRRLENNIAAWTSLPVGVVTLAEKFGGQDVSPEIYQAMVGHVLGLIDGFEGKGALGELANHKDFHLLGTSGTVTTLAGLLLGLERYDRRQVDGLWVTSKEMDDTTNTLKGWSVANACIGPDRADLVLAGCAVLDAIRQVWPSERLRVADRGLREGVLMNLMAADGAWRSNRFQPKHTNAAGQGA